MVSALSSSTQLVLFYIFYYPCLSNILSLPLLQRKQTSACDILSISRSPETSGAPQNTEKLRKCRQRAACLQTVQHCFVEKILHSVPLKGHCVDLMGGLSDLLAEMESNIPNIPFIIVSNYL